MNDFNHELLKMTLAAAVPLWIFEFKKLTPTQREAIAHEAGPIIAEKGDIIQFRSSKRGETAKAFNQLARGLAALAFVPGGVDFAGMHFEVP